MYPHGNDNRNDNRNPYPPDDRGRPHHDGPEDDDELLDEGEWPVMAVTHKIGFAGTNNEQIGVRCKFTEGPHKNKTLVWYGSFSDRALDITIRGLRALGMKGDDLRDLSGMYTDPGAAIGVVQHDEYQGKKRARIAFINGGDVVMKQEMNAQELSAFAQRMRGAFARTGGGKPSTPAAGPSVGNGRGAPPPRDQQQSFGNRRDEPPPPSDDDMPWNSRGGGRGR